MVVAVRLDVARRAGRDLPTPRVEKVWRGHGIVGGNAILRSLGGLSKDRGSSARIQHESAEFLSTPGLRAVRTSGGTSNRRRQGRRRGIDGTLPYRSIDRLIMPPSATPPLCPGPAVPVTPTLVFPDFNAALSAALPPLSESYITPAPTLKVPTPVRPE